MRFAAACVTILLALELAPLIATPHITTRGEAREALVVRDIVRTGRWVLPQRNGDLASKPPLYHWVAATFAHAFGLSDPVVRLPSALSAVALALLTLRLGMLMGGPRRGALAVGALLGCFLFWSAASEARVDTLFAACVTASLAGFWHWYREGSTRGRVVCYLAAAAAVLTKGPVGAVLPALVIGAFLVWHRDPRVRRLWSGAPAAIAGTPVVLWYAAAWHLGGDSFVARQLVSENLQRFVGMGSFAHNRMHHPLKLVGELIVTLLPWNLALVAAAPAADADDRADARFLHVWWIVILVFFSVAAGKRSIYLLPLYPAVALLAARWLDRRIRPGAAWIFVAIALFDLTVATAMHLGRVKRARASRLVPFAASVRATLPADARLVAAPGLPENDLLVLAYLLDRPLLRERPSCAPGLAWVVRAEDRDAMRVRLGDAALVPPDDSAAREGPLLMVCR